MKLGRQDKPWTPHFCCESCRSTLEGWMRGSRKSMPFAIPQIWREPTNRHDNCYFYMVDISKYGTENQEIGEELFIQLFPRLLHQYTTVQNCPFLILHLK